MPGFTDRSTVSWGKIGRAASEHVVVQLLKTKCLPVLYTVWPGSLLT